MLDEIASLTAEINVLNQMERDNSDDIFILKYVYETRPMLEIQLATYKRQKEKLDGQTAL